MADVSEAEGDVDVQDLTFQSEATDDEDDLTLTVCFYASRDGGDGLWQRPVMPRSALGRAELSAHLKMLSSLSIRARQQRDRRC